jgi:hypothetical protein
MAAPVLVPCLVQLRTELDELNPDRDRSSDGWIGDTAHQQRVSDHNDDEVGAVPIHDADTKHEVHALDADPDGLPMGDIVAGIVARCRAGKENRLRYVIWDHTIWEASNGWRARPYPGTDPHTGHAHFSASYDSIREADTRPWLKEIELLTDADKKFIEDAFQSALASTAGQASIGTAAGRGVHGQVLFRTGTTIGEAILETHEQVGKLAPAE